MPLRLGMPESDYPDVRALHLFSQMDAGNFQRLMRGSYVQNFPPRIELIHEGDPSDFLHVILAGSVELFSGWNGRETSMTTVRPVSTFILAATIREAPYLMSARTLEKSRIALIPSQEVREIFELDAQFARAIVLELAAQYRRVVKTTKELKLRNSLERLSNYLLRQQTRCGGAAQFELHVEKRKLASFLGMTPENLSRAFKNLRDHGVTVTGARVHVTDQKRLERFARPSPLIDDHGS